MKITINKTAIESIVSIIQPFIEKRDMSVITSCLLLQVQNGELIIKATDYEIGILAKLECESADGDDMLAVNGKKFLDSLKSLKDENITIEKKDYGEKGEKLEIKQGKSIIKLPSFIGENFPKFPKDYEKSKLNIDSKNLIDSLKRLLPVIEINNPRTEYRNALIDIKEYKFNFVATDTKRLEVISFDSQSVEKMNFMFPKKAIMEVQKLFAEDSNIYFNDKNVVIESEKFIFWTKIPNGNFIDYEKVIPKDIKYRVIIDKDKIIEALKIINAIWFQARLTFSKDKISFEVVYSDKDFNATAEIDLDSELNKEFAEKLGDETFSITVNSKHILDFVAHINTQTFEFGINENLHAASTLKSDNFLLTFMPILD